MRMRFALLAAAAVLAAGIGRAAGADSNDIRRGLRRAKSNVESARWDAERKSERADYHEGDTHYAQPFVGNTETKKVHRQECEWAEKIAPPNRVYFRTYRNAAAKGYEACRVCTPDAESPTAAPSPKSAAPPGAAASLPFIGNTVTRKAHRTGCEWAGKIAPDLRRGFASWKEAQQAGYVACGRCKPEMRALSQPPAPATPSPRSTAPPSAFIGHREKKKIHRAECSWAQRISEKNRTYFGSYAEAAAAGYAPCRTCRPNGEAPPTPSPTAVRGGWIESPGEPAFVGDTVSMKVHRAGCARAQEIPARNRIYFARFADASAAGQTPCPVCAPGDDAPAAATAGAAMAGSRPFVGHAASRKVHRAECSWAGKIAEKNRVYFTSFREAAAAGYSACKACRPDEERPAPAKAPAPSPAARAPAPAEKFRASSAGKTFHLPSCE